MEDEEIKDIHVSRALIYTNAAYVISDIAVLMAQNAEDNLKHVCKRLNGDDKRQFRMALDYAKKAKNCARGAARFIYNINCADNACNDSDYLAQMLLLIIDRTADSPESKKEMIELLKSKPSVMKFKEWLSDNPDYLDL